MLKDYNKYKVLKVFLFNPTESFRLRELSRKVNLAPTSLLIYLKMLEKQGLIQVKKKDKIKFYFSQRDSREFKRYQKLSMQYELYESGIIDKIWEDLNPEAIIFYGSYAKGEATETSDIDLFVMCSQKAIDLQEYEKKIGKEVHLMFEIGDKIPNELKNNLTNGIVMAGYFKAF